MHCIEKHIEQPYVKYDHYTLLKGSFICILIEKHQQIINDSIERLVGHGGRLGATSIDEDNVNFVQSIEAAFSRLTNDNIHHISVKDLKIKNKIMS